VLENRRSRCLITVEFLCWILCVFSTINQPETLWNGTETSRVYTRKTTLTRVRIVWCEIPSVRPAIITPLITIGIPIKPPCKRRLFGEKSSQLNCRVTNEGSSNRRASYIRLHYRLDADEPQHNNRIWLQTTPWHQSRIWSEMPTTRFRPISKLLFFGVYS